MEGKTVAVQNGSTGQEALEKLMGKNNPAIRKTPMSIQMLIGGQVDALVGDETSVKSICASYPDQHLKSYTMTKPSRRNISAFSIRRTKGRHCSRNWTKPFPIW